MREPDWTDVRDHDPGLTLLALIASLAIGLLLVRRLIAERRRHRRTTRDDE
ncbi:MAG: hypothetical protein M3303_09650 [Gemmatimonadota bacterium]|nr:hypothetical protein [Gemmatimonadota bacterium]